MKMEPVPLVIKVGGSLFGDHLWLHRLQTVLNTLPSGRVLLIPGGGKEVKALRAASDAHPLSDDAAHWRCIEIMSGHARQFSLAPGFALVTTWNNAETAWEDRNWPWLDVLPFLRQDDAQPDRLPHNWDVSSDSIAAQVARRHGANLLLLKSCPIPDRFDSWESLARKGIVDAWFPRVAGQVRIIEIKNLPRWPLSINAQPDDQSATTDHAGGKPLPARQ